MNSVKDRMRAVVEALGFTSYEAFEDAVGLGHGFVSRIKATVSRKSLQKIVDTFPQVNVHYIKTGEGEMFGEPPANVTAGTVRERFNTYLKHKGIKRKDFISSTGVYQTFPLERNSFSATIRYRINSIYPDLNMDWLATGVGDMLQTNCNLENLTDYKQRIGIFCKQMGISVSFFLSKSKFHKSSLQKLPKLLTEDNKKDIALAFPQLSLAWLVNDKGDMLNNDINHNTDLRITNVPLVLQRAYAGYLNGYADEYYVSKLPTIPIVKTDNEKYVAFEISGDSMDDSTSMAYQNSDIVICRNCPDFFIKNNILNFKNKEFIIVHKDGILLKRITDINMVDGTITLHSFNPLFSDLILQLADVRQILEVVFQQKKRL